MSKILKNSQKHLDEVNESYSEHACFAMKTGFRLIKLGFMAIGHGILPSLWPSNVSHSILEMSQNIQKRKTRDS